jgi:hypothetical protein
MEGPVNKDDMSNSQGRLNYPWSSNISPAEQKRDLLKQEFSQPFNEGEVEARFLDPEKIPYEEAGSTDSMYQVYSRQVGTYNYRILDLKSRVGETKDMFFELAEDSAQSPRSELVFRALNSQLAGKGFNLAHRSIRTQEAGIGGGTFLRKAEDYLSILKKKGLIQCDWIAVDSRQPNVTEFFLKNGYRFLTDGNTVYEKYLSNPEAFEIIDFDFTDDPSKRDPAPVLKEAFNDPEFMSYVTETDGKKKIEIDFHKAKKFEKYFPMVILGKDI